jgi:hypothetical protein
MGSDENRLHEVLFGAVWLAQTSGASEIGIEHLLAALDGGSIVESLPGSSFLEQVPENGGGFANSSEWMPLSSGVAAAIAPFGGFEGITIDVLRSALVSARERGEH